MTETTNNEELAAELEDLERETVDADGDDIRAQVEAQLAKWRQWIDELVVQADLGRLDVRDELRDLVQRLENSYLALKNEAEKAVDRNQGRGEQVQKVAAGAAGDLKEGLTKATDDLRSAARKAYDQVRKAA
ncbi:MAG: hypothetical protein JNK12_21915 [Acidimicrobiales bacterium]|nr:hypothetical protein [Acidimicrobiales bacterium]